MNAGPLPLSYGYRYNQANQRTQMTLADGTKWVYQYDDLGQVISGRRYWADGTPVAGQQFEYGFDDIGNRTTTGGRASAISTYTVNALNQYTPRTVAGAVGVLGFANPTATETFPHGGPHFRIKETTKDTKGTKENRKEFGVAGKGRLVAAAVRRGKGSARCQRAGGWSEGSGTRAGPPRYRGGYDQRAGFGVPPKPEGLTG